MNSEKISHKLNIYITKYWASISILIIAVNLTIRFIGIPMESLYGDEIFSIFFAQQPLNQLYEILLYDRNPPLYFFLLHFWIKLFGLNSIVLKGLSVLFSLGTAYFLLKLSSRHLNKLTAILASSLFILSNVWLIASHEIRAFSLIGFLTILSFYFYLNILKQSRVSSAIGLTFVNLLLLFSHYISFYVPLLQFLCSFLFLKENKKGFRYYFFSQLIALVLYIPWIKIVIGNIPDQESFWLETANLDRLFSVFTNLSGNELVWAIHLIFLGSFIFLFLFDKNKRFIKSSFDLKVAVILLLWYLLPVLLNYFLAQFIPIFRLKYLLYASLGLILLVPYMLSVLQIHLIFRIILIGFLILPSFILFSSYPPVSENWKKYVPKIIKLKDSKTAVLICNWEKHRDFAYYYDLEIFQDYLNIGWALRTNEIHAIADSNSLKDAEYDWADKLIYVRSHDKVGDPNNTNIALLKRKNYKLCRKFGHDMLQVEIYLKDYIPCDSLVPIHMYELKDCDIWEKELVHDFYGDTCVRYFNDMENDPFCKESINQTNSPSFRGKFAAVAIDSLEYCSPLFLPIQELDTINIIDISFMAFMETFNDARVVCSIEGSGNQVFMETYEIRNSVKNLHRWEKVAARIKLPENRDKNAELRFYIWNPNPEPVYIDNVELGFKYLPI